MPHGYRQNELDTVKAKMLEYRIKDFSDRELHRAFKDVCAPVYCFEAAKHMIREGLTIEELYAQKLYRIK